MKHSPLALGLSLSLLLSACHSNNKPMEISQINDSLTSIQIEKSTKFILLPIQESADEVPVRLLGDRPENTWLDIRLATDSIDYYVPMPLPEGKVSTLEIAKLSDKAITWDSIKLSNTFDPGATDYYRPKYHYSPLYGWMNDPNGLIYDQGTYHLYYQYNPYGSKWGNMYWGHASSKDLIHWNHETPALARDTLGHIFSGSAILDKDGLAGFGKGAILAFYTAHQKTGSKQWQAQCLAYSTDGGKTYTKYKGNPILTPHDGVADFRDPKVFYYAPSKAWYMIVSADKEMRFYKSYNLKSWDYVSAFGEGYGARPNQFECPDFFELPLEGSAERKWVMIVNINPGSPFGGSATEYFVGSFDGKTFVPDTEPEVARWLDFGKDHYAFVTFHNLRGRTLGMPWVSNWQYANVTPYKQSRGINGLPRELFLFESEGRTYVGSRPARETALLRKQTMPISDVKKFSDSLVLKRDLNKLDDCFELDLTLQPQGKTTKKLGFIFSNELGDKLPIYIDLEKERIVMDRTESGLVSFGKDATPHEREGSDWRTGEGINYKNDFALATWAPLSLCKGKTFRLRLFIDRSTAELFVDGGRIAMTNLIFPRKPYSILTVFSEGGASSLSATTLYRLSL